MRTVAVQALCRILALLLCLCMVLACVLPTVNADDAQTETDDTIMLEYQSLPEGYLPWLFADETLLTENSENAMELEYDENITGIKLYYLVGNNWVEITDDNNTDLPADTQYKFDFTYSGISVSDLIEHDGKMVYRGLPDWFQPTGTGVLMYGDTVAALIEAVDGEIVITFDPDWLSQHSDDTSFGGTFSVAGRVDWHELEDEDGSKGMPGLNVEPNFEGNLAQKYGKVTLDKTQPELEKGEDGYYLKYTLTVTNEDSTEMTQITVKDVFANIAYIESYIGVTDEEKELPNADLNDMRPWESGTQTDFTPGKLSGDNSGMLWDIGILAPGETRTLTYYAKIDDSYVDNLVNNPIINRADVYAGEYLKDTDAASFTPKNEVNLVKDHGEILIGPEGTGTIEYTITITADEENSFTMDGLTLKDMFPEELKSYLSGGENGKITVTAESESQGTATYEADYANGSFEFTGLALAPGETVTITYTIHVTNIFLASGEQVQLTNAATVSKGGRDLSGNLDTVTLDKHTWTRKIAGDRLENPETIEMDPSDGVYQYENGAAKGIDNPGSFTVPEGSIQYHIVLNEGGQWDLSSTTMTDQFSNGYLTYVGYVQIQIFERDENAPENASDNALIGELENASAVRTVWIQVNGDGSFSFSPEELGFPEGKYTYLLTYYAKPTGMENIGSVEVSNSFEVKGDVGVGNGTVTLPGVNVSVSKTVQGGVSYDAKKISWYYTPSPVYRTVDESVYSEKDFSGDYTNGAIYWVIRLAGDIQPGYAVERGNQTSLSGFYLKDTPGATTGTSGIQFKRDSVVGVYVGDKDFDFTSYDSFPAFVEADNAGLTKLKGNPQNDKWFGAYQNSPTTVEDADYKWFAENTSLDGIIFTEDFVNSNKYDKETDAIYIVLRTILMQPVPTTMNSSRTYTNNLGISSEGVSATVDTAQYTYTVTTQMLKETKGAYIYDKVNDTFTRCSDETGGDWIPSVEVQKDLLDSSGIYAVWLLNINNDGSMEGTYDVIDYLPAGMELVYVDVNNYGNGVRGDKGLWPQTEYIQELNKDPAWRELEQTSEVLMGGSNRGEATAITYYNSETGEIRWRISNFTSASDGTVRREINLCIICKVVDPELFLDQIKTYENTADLLNPETNDPDDIVEREIADVTIRLPQDKSLDKEALRALGGIDNEGNVQFPLTVNRLPFKIEINPLGLELNGGSTFPPLIDELSSTLALIESTLKITIVDGTPEGTPYTDYTYTVEYRADGGQTLIISGLPDNTPLTISYDARLIGAPKESVSVSNTAYWAGHKKPDEPQFNEGNASYWPSGDVFVEDKIRIDIIKVDADSHSKRLDGAVFEFYEVDENGNPTGDAIRTGTSDSMGKVTFDNQNGQLPRLAFDTVYCLKEVQTPVGYSGAGDYYFVLVDLSKMEDMTGEAIKNGLEEKYGNYNLNDLHFWYDGAECELVIENPKGAISVTKVFVNENGEEFMPTSGKYRFGLFDADDVLLETLTIEYTDEGANYYLDDVPKDSPRFTKYDPERVYQVYELDANGDPIKADRDENDLVCINGIYYRVTYSPETLPDLVFVNRDVRITNMATEPTMLPGTGGIGTIGYYTAGCMLMLLALLSCLFMRRCGTRRK